MDDKVATLRKRRTAGSQRPDDCRDQFQRDYGRIIHSPAFRRLQGKSQVFGAGSGDYYRTRLTHSLEVAQISRSVSDQLRANEDYIFLRTGNDAALLLEPVVVECAALAHDMGHPPFGHKGERVLDDKLIQRGYRFEGNAQNFRILTYLEKRLEPDGDSFVSVNGLNLTAAVLLATNKYPRLLSPEGTTVEHTLRTSHRYWKLSEEARGPWLARHETDVVPEKLGSKGLYPREWAIISDLREAFGLPEGKRTVEAQVMDLCDDIAYSTHDIEDGIRAGMIRLELLTLHAPESNRIVDAIVKELEGDRTKEPTVWGAGVDLRDRVQQVFELYSESWKLLMAQAGSDGSRARRELKARWVNRYVTKVGIVDDAEWKRVTLVKSPGCEDTELRQEMAVLKKLAWVTMVLDFRVQRLERRSERIVRGLAQAFRDEKTAMTLFPTDWIQRYERADEPWPWERFAADYMAGFTDAYAEKVYAELYGAKSGSIYDVD